MTSALFRELSRLLPSYNISLAIAEGPFEDDYGVGAHFEALALKSGPKQKHQLTVDFHVSVIKLARAVAMHKPRLIYGTGQGGLIALGYSHPGFLEAVMASRNVQPPELPELCQSWGQCWCNSYSPAAFVQSWDSA